MSVSVVGGFECQRRAVCLAVDGFLRLCFGGLMCFDGLKSWKVE